MDKLVSVLMSVHNEPSQFINVAVNSICKQTYKNIEFIIIDDNSNEETFRFLQNLAKVHSNIKLYRNENNLGLTASLNRGLSLCSGDFIARMDADDYSCPERIAHQVYYLSEHSDIDILGTGVVSFGEKVMFMSPIDGYTPPEVQSNLFFTSSLCHPSVMIRASFLNRTGLTYDVSVKKGQDFDLWERASVCGKLAVLKDVLLYYRLHPKQITSTNRADQDATARKIMLRRIKRLGINPTESEMEAHMALKSQNPKTEIREISLWIKKLIKASESVPYINSNDLANNLYSRFANIKLKSHHIPNFKDLRFILKMLYSRVKMRTLQKQFSKTINITI